MFEDLGLAPGILAVRASCLCAWANSCRRSEHLRWVATRCRCASHDSKPLRVRTTRQRCLLCIARGYKVHGGITYTRAATVGSGDGTVTCLKTLALLQAFLPSVPAASVSA